MTAGEYLLSRSSLSSGTALAHLLAIQAGAGQGTVFASMFSVHVERPITTASAPRQVIRTVREPAPVTKTVHAIANRLAINSDTAGEEPVVASITQRRREVVVTTAAADTRVVTTRLRRVRVQTKVNA